MSKGDRIEVQAIAGNVPGSVAITASKAGRTVRQRQTYSKTNGRWLVVEELTRNGGKTGRSIQIRLDAVVAIIEERVDVDEARKAKPRRAARKPGAEPLLLPLDDDPRPGGMIGVIARDMGVPEDVAREALATSHPDASPSEVEWRANEIMEARSDG
jgi:hypothetical protein